MSTIESNPKFKKLFDIFLNFEGKPPILFPLLWIEWLVIITLSLPFVVGWIVYQFTIRPLFYVFPLWLVGYWWCASCGERQTIRDKKHTEKAYRVGSYHREHVKVCKECKRDY